MPGWVRVGVCSGGEACSVKAGLHEYHFGIASKSARISYRVHIIFARCFSYKYFLVVS